ncbi:MAG: DNA repair protein RecO [Candidatus Aminicenantes bacterium]|jgi:DNA repair protein RecO (recombination protein O)
MPLEQSEGFILKTFNVGEQDKIVVLFSKEKGIFKGVAKGARKFGNRFGSSLEPLSHVKLFYYEKEGKELVTISSSDLLESFFEIQKDLKTSSTLSYFAELIEEFYPARSKDDILFRLLQSVLSSLKARADLHFTSAYFEAWFLRIGGILPDFRRCKRCRAQPDEKTWLSSKKDGVLCTNCVSEEKIEVPQDINLFLTWIKQNPPPRDPSVPFNPDVVQAIRKVFRSIIVFHMEKEPKSLRFLD